MKNPLILFLFLSMGSFAQNNTQLQKEKDNLEVALENQKKLVQNMSEELEALKQLSDSITTQIQVLRKENETLKQIMINYIKQIDQLNTENMELRSKVDEQKN